MCQSLTVQQQQGSATFSAVLWVQTGERSPILDSVLKKKSLISVTTPALHRFLLLTQPPRGVGPPTHVLVS